MAKTEDLKKFYSILSYLMKSSYGIDVSSEELAMARINYKLILASEPYVKVSVHYGASIHRLKLKKEAVPRILYDDGTRDFKRSIANRTISAPIYRPKRKGLSNIFVRWMKNFSREYFLLSWFFFI